MTRRILRRNRSDAATQRTLDVGGRGGTWGDAERRSLEEVALEEGLCVESVPRCGVPELDATNRSAGGQ